MNELTNEPWPVQCPLVPSQSGRIYSTFNFRAAMNIFLTEYCTWNHKYQATRLIIMLTQRCLVTVCFEWKNWRVHRMKWISYKWPYCSERWLVTCARISRIQVTKYCTPFSSCYKKYLKSDLSVEQNERRYCEFQQRGILWYSTNSCAEGALRRVGCSTPF